MDVDQEYADGIADIPHSHDRSKWVAKSEIFRLCLKSINSGLLLAKAIRNSEQHFDVVNCAK
jgi:hypothetical protein